jgi:ABC-type nitrate/sulfonate/bicarbonate transport system substrate-binding protein
MLKLTWLLSPAAALVLLPQLTLAEPVKIALPVASLESMPIYIAEDKGLFKKHGLDIDVITSRGGGEAMKAYIAGEVQIVATGFPELGLMRAKNVDVMLYFAQTSRVPFALLARTGTNVKSVADLKGKTIAVTSPGSLTANLTNYFVKQAGLDPARDVNLVSVGGGGEILGALKSERADAAMLFEPFVAIAVKQGIATVLVDVAKELDAFSSSPLSTSKDFLEKRPQDAKALFEALVEAQQFIKDNHAGVLELAKKRFSNADPNVLESALDRIYQVYSPNGKFGRSHVERTEAISVELKIMPKSYPYDEVVAPMARE